MIAKRIHLKHYIYNLDINYLCLLLYIGTLIFSIFNINNSVCIYYIFFIHYKQYFQSEIINIRNKRILLFKKMD